MPPRLFGTGPVGAELEGNRSEVWLDVSLNRGGGTHLRYLGGGAVRTRLRHSVCRDHGDARENDDGTVQE